jgi:hypothetical protein
MRSAPHRASFLDEDQRAGVDGHLPDMGETVAGTNILCLIAGVIIDRF